LQDALVAIWQKVSQPDFSLSSRLDTLVFAIARNLWLKNLRKQHRIIPSDFDSKEIVAEADNSSTTDEQAAVLSKYL
jgi:DNA-directed RNA polymerase specialized sigma24 family protein